MSNFDVKVASQLRLIVELARPLAHESNNFLNNFLLQLAISENSFPDSSRAEWANLRREARKLADLFQQWQRQQQEYSECDTVFDLHSKIASIVDDLRAGWPNVKVQFDSTYPSVYQRGSESELRCLLAILTKYALSEQSNKTDRGPTLHLSLSSIGDKACLELSFPNAIWTGFDEISNSERKALLLDALACKSLVERFFGNIYVKSDSDAGSILAIEFRLARVD